jgi:hypothetical protein
VAGDGRGVAASLTEAGVSRLRVAARTHLAGVSRHFVDRLDAAEMAQLESISGKLSG